MRVLIFMVLGGIRDTSSVSCFFFECGVSAAGTATAGVSAGDLSFCADCCGIIIGRVQK
jgi:hypothetical protein